MANHDYVIANQNGANTRSDLNNALSAIVSNNSSATEPSTTYAFMWWADTATDILKQRNAADSAWINILTLSTGAPLADYADNTLSGNAIDGGTISNFASTGIDDNATSTAITIDASEQVSIGTTTSVAHLTVDAPSSTRSASFSGNGIDIIHPTLPTHLNLGTQGGSDVKISSVGAYPMLFYTNSAKRMTISSSGNIQIGTFSTSGATAGVDINPIGGTGHGITSSTHSTSFSYQYRFYNPNGQVGYISTSSSATLYNTASDYRLKKDDLPMVDSIDRLKLLRPINFAWKADNSRTDGFFAHEVQAVVPECVGGTKDGMMDEEYEVTPAVMDGETVVTEAVMGTRSVPDYQGIDQSKLVPLLTAALQEAVAKIEALEARVTALEV